MKIKLKTLDGLDADSAAQFKNLDDGSFEFEAEDVTGLKTALQKERDNAGTLSKQIKAWQGLGKSPEEISELLKGQEDLAKQKEDLAMQEALKKGEYQKVLDGEAKKREQMAAKHQADLESATKQGQGYKSALERYLIEGQATAAILAAKGEPDFLLHKFRERMQVVEVDGRFDVQILDASGKPMIADAKGSPATINDLVEEFKATPKYGRAFEGTNASGGGGNGGGGKPNTGQKTMSRDAFNQLDAPSQMAFMVKDKGTLTD